MAASAAWRHDGDFEEAVVSEVEKLGPACVLKRADGWQLYVQAPGFELPERRKYRFFGRGIGYSVRGVVLMGEGLNVLADAKVVFYRTAAEEAQRAKDETYPPTAEGALKKWDAGQTVFTVEMGGLGPGYEQAIHVAVFEILRECLKPGPALTYPALADVVIERIGGRLNLSGAQAGQAKNLALIALRDGWQKTVTSFADDRLIQVSNAWPLLEAPTSAELLEALKETADPLHDCETASECAVLIAKGEAVSCARIRRARAAIAKAEGRS